MHHDARQIVRSKPRKLLIGKQGKGWAMSERIWKPVRGCENGYTVSNDGLVRSVKSTGKRYSGEILSPHINPKNGYSYYDLQGEWGRRNVPVHHIVAGTFLGEAPKGTEICHNDGNPSNNHVDNLRYDSRSSNMTDRVKHGVHHQVNKTFCPRGHELNDANNLPSMRKKGHRRCASCNRAMSYSRLHPEWKDRLQELSDSYYEKIVSVE